MSSVQFIRRRALFAAATLAAIVALGAGAFAVRSTSAQTKAAAAQPQAVPVPVAVIEEREVTMWDEFSGRLEAVERVDVRSRVAGAVKSVHFTEGALVKRDDLLVTIDPDPYAAEVDRAQAQVVAAQARVNYTKSERERAQRLWTSATRRCGRRCRAASAGSRSRLETWSPRAPAHRCSRPSCR
jgi:multidrug efflux system membrane fusion protein